MVFFKKLFVTFFLLCAVACQKEYAPDPITTNPSTGGGGSSSGSSSARLTKVTITSDSVIATKTYEYNSAGKLSKCTTTSVVSGQTIISIYTFTRDNTNKIISYLLNYNIAGFPSNGVTYTCHYPTGSTLFDYVTGRYAFYGTTSIADSVIFSSTNGKIASVKTYQDVVNSGYQASGSSTYSYDNSGNISEYKFYNLSSQTGNLDLSYSIVYSYDSKPNCLQLDQEAFILGGDMHIGKNNYIKQVRTDYTTVAAGVNTTTNYSYSYNLNSQPTTATGTDTKGGKATITYTYQ